jgi:hypothetical protein
MNRSLAALTVALLLALVVTTVVVDVAFGAIVGPRYQAENMIETSGSISVQSDPDGTGPAGPTLSGPMAQVLRTGRRRSPQRSP